MGLFGDVFGKKKTAGYDEYDEGYEYEQPAAAPAPAPGVGISGGSAALELKVVRPTGFGDVTNIAAHLLAHRTVVLNLEATGKEDARRQKGRNEGGVSDPIHSIEHARHSPGKKQGG